MLETVGLHKTYRGKTVVKNVSLAMMPGEIVGLLGPNGAGKTTLFRMIAGVIAPSQGEVLLNQERITTLPLYRRALLGMSYLSQESSIFRKMTVEDNIRAVLEVRSPAMTPLEQSLRVDILLEEFGLERLAKQISATLSGGERRRLEIARALAHAPRFLLLDEPFSGIDPIVVMEIQQILYHLKARGIGIAITDHNVHETLRVCDRAYILSAGEILLSGTPAEISESALARAVYLGDRFRLFPEVIPSPGGVPFDTQKEVDSVGQSR